MPLMIYKSITNIFSFAVKKLNLSILLYIFNKCGHWQIGGKTMGPELNLSLVGCDAVTLLPLSTQPTQLAFN